MRVILERETKTGVKSIRLIAEDVAQKPETVAHWIRMLRLAERWLRLGKPKE